MSNDPRRVTLQQLHNNTAQIIQDIHQSGGSAVITRQGRLLAVITPLPVGVESSAVGEWLDDTNPADKALIAFDDSLRQAIHDSLDIEGGLQSLRDRFRRDNSMDE